ncbi:FAD-dependent monooxygenase [Mesorhizobium sp. L-8-3]|uniref:FAD-dependent monooxygenase n=1 Tax=Mesorhizobium sp. L-8-3 TaxID=2744522 RepID=UPI0019271436|nr:FAD-dependent monooxygenase [Mesorhizobium sp. L-8-3]BCH20695.1 pentachlorophenol monooxygenase [Mesorhizobium sp. L-8-3]
MAVITDVLVVGAGPAGLATAIGLAQRGIDFRIVDALPEAQNTSRAAVIHAATLESLRGLQVEGRLIAQGIKVPNFRMRDRDSVLLHVDFTGLPSPTPYALMIPQDESERILIDRLAALGHVVERPVRLQGIEITGGRIRAGCVGPHGELVIEARYIVGADGEKSTVRTQAGIGFPGETYGSFLLADVRMDWPIAKDEVTLFFSEAGTLVVAPMSGDRHRVVAQLPDAPSVPTVSDVQKVIDTRGPRSGAGVREILWGSRFQVHHKLADRFRDGSVLLVGDAAHVHSPAGGQGMNLGLRDAAALSQALAEAIRNGSDAALDGYAAARRSAAAEVLATTDRLTRVATLSDPASRWLRNRAIGALGFLPVVRSYAARKLAGFS